MYGTKRVIAIIPARGGSKRLPRKNILPFAGRPLIIYSVEHAKKSKYIDDVFVSSDDEEILKISREAGAKIIKRPEEYASDTATTLSVMKHAISHIEKYHYNPDIVVLLQVTTPLRKPENIDLGIERLINRNADSAIGVSKRHLAPNWIFKKEGDYINFILPNDFNLIRSQDQPDTYEITGGLYVYKRDVLMSAEKYALGDKIVSVIMDKDELADIDDIDDFKLAETKLNLRK